MQTNAQLKPPSTILKYSPSLIATSFSDCWKTLGNTRLNQNKEIFLSDFKLLHIDVPVNE